LARIGPCKIFTCNQFHQHFMRSFCNNFFLPINYKDKLLAEKICAEHFCTKKLLVKCCSNFHLMYLACHPRSRPEVSQQQPGEVLAIALKNKTKNNNYYKKYKKTQIFYKVSISSTFYTRIFCQYFGVKKFQSLM